MIQRLVLSAPFGNYLSFAGATSTLGTFTRQNRGGLTYRLWRMLRTLRYYPGIQAWKNKLGLPNSGIDSLWHRCVPPRYGPVSYQSHKIISIAGFCLSDWHYCATLAFGLRPLAVECNVSCPNCPGEDKSDYGEVFKALVELSKLHRSESPLIVKLAPLGYMRVARQALDAGIRSFHCCNTLPTPNGGISGKPLKAFSLQAIEDLRNYCHARDYDLDILIGGGGVTTANDINDYLDVGATSVAIGSHLLAPWHWLAVRRWAASWSKRPYHSTAVVPV